MWYEDTIISFNPGGVAKMDISPYVLTYHQINLPLPTHKSAVWQGGGIMK
jgi:hypothetical protein